MLPFGHREGFGIYLHGVNLPAEVYQTRGVNFVSDEIDHLLSS
ncbi:hypothetical protein [Prosthecobacter sp.]|nr:hypothetical protein [Prosthecobacter sp.]MDI1311318.1 hypothetical protein [Prosthecobacter sp.]